MNVTTTSDPDNGVGSCSTGGSCSLREAVNESDVEGGSGVISVPAGTYMLDPTLGPVNFTASATLTGRGAAATAITGSNGTRIMQVAPGATVDVSDVTLENGNAGAGAGGAVQVPGGASLTLSDATLTGNVAAGNGGAIEDQGTLVVDASTLLTNRAGGDGGAIAEDRVGTPSPSTEIQDSYLASNASGAGGGAIWMLGSPSGSGTTEVVITSSAFFANAAGTDGGAVDEAGGDVGTNLDVTDATFDANTAAGSGAGVGGGVALGNSDAGEVFVNDTLDGNVAGAGGSGGDVGLGGGEQPIFRNTIVADGHSESGPDCNGAVLTEGNNLDGANGCGFVTAPAGSDLVNTDPDLGPLQDNGGLTPTMALLPGSPAINAGTRDECPVTDARGVPRPQGTGCDIGAYEAAPPVAGPAAALSVGTTTAALGVVAANPDPEFGVLGFQFGTSNAYGSTSAALTVLPKTNFTAYAVTLSGLSPATVYHFRLVAVNPSGYTVGPDESFTTAGSAQPNPTPTPGASAFTIGGTTVSPSGALTIALGAPGAGGFSAKATFTARKAVVRHRRGRRVVKHVLTTYAYGTGHAVSARKSTLTLEIAVRHSAASELKKLGGATVRISVVFTPAAGSAQQGSTRLFLKRSRKGQYS